LRGKLLALEQVIELLFKPFNLFRNLSGLPEGLG